MTGIRTTSDGREICLTREAWNRRRHEVLKRDKFRCRDCGRLVAETMKIAEMFGLPVAHIDHQKKRGIGGGKRDDRLEKLKTKCPLDHARRHA